MKMTLRHGLVAASALLALATLPLLAGPHRGQGPGGEGRGGQGLGRFLPPASYLDLTADQEAAVEQLKTATEAQIKASMESQRADREELRTLLESSNPDAATVGNLTIQMHQGRQAVKTILQTAEQSFIALLNDEQKTKYEAFRELRQDRRENRQEHRGGRGHGRGGFGNGDGNDGN